MGSNEHNLKKIWNKHLFSISKQKDTPLSNTTQFFFPIVIFILFITDY